MPAHTTDTTATTTNILILQQPDTDPLGTFNAARAPQLPLPAVHQLAAIKEESVGPSANLDQEISDPVLDTEDMRSVLKDAFDVGI